MIRKIMATLMLYSIYVVSAFPLAYATPQTDPGASQYADEQITAMDETKQKFQEFRVEISDISGERAKRDRIVVLIEQTEDEANTNLDRGGLTTEEANQYQQLLTDMAQLRVDLDENLRALDEAGLGEGALDLVFNGIQENIESAGLFGLDWKWIGVLGLFVAGIVTGYGILTFLGFVVLFFVAAQSVLNLISGGGRAAGRAVGGFMREAAGGAMQGARGSSGQGHGGLFGY